MSAVLKPKNSKPVRERVGRDEWQMRACTFTEFTIRAFYKGYAITEAPIRHLPRPFGASRGVPLRGIPRSILHVLTQFADLKRKIRAGTL